MEQFRSLGDTIATQWQKADFDGARLPNIAGEALAAFPVGSVSAADILRWVRTTDHLPRQEDPRSRFGQPPLTLYRHEHFYITALFWHTSTTSVHQHAFSGAFTVLEGSSLQVHYAFEPTHIVDDRVRIGDLTLMDAEMLQPGSVQHIRGGPAFIHSVFHLDAPTVSLVVRNGRDVDAGPQYDYHPPYLCLDPFAESPLFLRRFQCLKLLLELKASDFEDAVIDTIRHSDAYTCCRVLSLSVLQHDVEVSRERLLDAAHQRHGAWVAKLPAVWDDMSRRSLIISRRSLIHDPNQRFFLALLANFRSGHDILQVLGERYPHQSAVDSVMEFVTAMSGTDIVGIEFDELNTDLFRLLVQGVPARDLLHRLADMYDPEDIEAQRASLEEHIQAMIQTHVFKTLFTTRTGVSV